MKKLPIGISTFKEIREENYYYADKTSYVKKLVDEGKYYFISRPRRFGKTLFADTLKEAFSGRKDLFKGLYLEDHWDWSVSHPVLFLSFGGGVLKNRRELDEFITDRFEEIFTLYDLKLKQKNTNLIFRDLIVQLNKKYDKRAVVIVDEYDKPILDNITDEKAAYEIRDGLKNIYSVIKDSDAYIKFAFLTGVTKFSKVSLFSGLNNLEDITLTESFSGICGYTQEELESEFKERLPNVDMKALKKWYNGYNFLGAPVYNPYDVLLFLKNKKFKNYWFETATPGFLTDLIKQKQYYIPKLENCEVGEEVLGSFDIDYIFVETLLFQTGYLTIEGVEELANIRKYRLGFPNLEVKSSFANYILNYFVSDASIKVENQTSLYRVLQKNDVQSLNTIFYSFFSAIPNDWYRKNMISGYEGYYASVFYCYFAALGLDVIPEDTTNKGRIDMTLKFEGRVYIFEFKVIDIIKHQGTALNQIKNRKYYEKYTKDFDEIYLIGIEFSSKEKNIVNFDWKRV